MDIIYYIWLFIQLLFGFNLVLPIILYFIWRITRSTKKTAANQSIEADYGIVVTAYEHIDTLTAVVNSILKMNYSAYMVYVVADKCDISGLKFDDQRVVLLRPDEVLGSNIKSHLFATQHFVRPHDRITIIDSDNLVHSEYLNELNVLFNRGFIAVQGVRKAKNLNTTIATLDAARDMYYHFYDGKVLFEIGSSATLAGSGMAFELVLYQNFLTENPVEGAGFDKVLQAWIVKQDFRIAFAEQAFVYDEKTSRSQQLVQQRSRWINTWFKYFTLGFGIIKIGIINRSLNQLIFGLILLRPPLFIFLFISVACIFTNMFFSITGVLIWLGAFILFVAGFYLALLNANADIKIYKSLMSIPKFMYFQLVSLAKSRNANKRSVATKHYQNQTIDDINNIK